MEAKNYYEINGAFLSEKATEMLQLLQNDDNKLLKEKLVSIDDATTFIAKTLSKVDDSEAKAARQIIGELSDLKGKLKNLFKL